jgi:putative addiction module component (TIGR02574 family)
MSKTEILVELPRLTPEDRREIWIRLNELDGPINDDWTGCDLSSEEKALIEARLDECEANPQAFIPWKEAEARLKARFGS